ncbi:MAG: hypothetical protein AB1427_08705 [Thermodesulfobacteriota bacterium]
MDKTVKILLSIIAAALVLIAIKLWEPREAHSGFVGGGPTFGKLKSAKGESLNDIIDDMPVVFVFRIIKN